MRLQAFVGTWDIDRAIDDVRAGQSGRFTGRARFTPAPEGLHYREEGTLTLGDAPPLAASRDYLWRDAGAGGIEVLFGDGRYFHRIAPDAATPGDTHDCPPDLYHVRYDFTGWPRWRAEWRVTGPRKDYAMLSRYQPHA